MKNKDNKLINIANWIMKHKTITTIIVILLFSIPLIIVHFLFKWDSNNYWIVAEWSAGDIIAYIAGFEAFIGTTLLSFLALWQNQKHKLENDAKDQKILEIENEKIRLSNLPQFIIQSADYNKAIDTKHTVNAPGRDIVMLDYLKTHGFFINTTGKYWIPSDKLPGIERSALTNFNSIINCGNNTAHQVKLIMTIDGIDYRDEKTLSLKKDDEIYLYIGIDKNIPFASDLILTIRYFDCFQNVYEQKFKVINTAECMHLISYSNVTLLEKNPSMQITVED